MEQGPLGLAPGLRTPAGRTCQRTPGEGRASSTRPELYARHNRTSFPHAHSQCATSCRTTGLDMTRFPTAARLVSWAGLCPSARQSGPRTRTGKKNQGDSWLRNSLGQAATGASRTATFLGERYGRIARRRGKAKAQVAVARSILTIIWQLLADPAARYTDLGASYYQTRTDTDRKLRNHIRQIRALGYEVTITNAA